MDTLSEIPDGEWTDCKASFETAMSELAIGQLVRDPRYTMMDLMSAIEINDPRTDSCVAARNTSRARLPDFDPSRLLKPREVTWIIDEIMRLEATFQDGQPLMSTLWTCNYLRVPSLQAVASSCGHGPIDSVQAVFRAMLLGILKTQEIIWEECCKGQVYEHEDVHLASSTLSFDHLMAACYTPRSNLSPSPPSEPNPLLVAGQQPQASPSKDRTVSIDDALKLLDEASSWLQSQNRDRGVEEQEALEQLSLRISLRIDLLYILALLTFPAHTSPSQIENHLVRISSYMSQLPSSTSSASLSPFDPPPDLVSTFAPSPSIPLLATSAPPRMIEPLPLGESYDRNVRNLVAELRGLCQLWDGWRREGDESRMGWKEVKEYSRMLARREVSPYLRSLHQTVLTSTPSHVFSVSPLVHFSISFLSTFTSIPSSFFLETIYSVHRIETDYSSPAHVVLAWLEKLAQELLRTSLPLAGQNRTRQFRWIKKSILNWEQLVHETKTGIVPLLLSIAEEHAGTHDVKGGIAKVESAIRLAFLDLILENVGSGFEEEMELYREDERPRVWFVLGKLAEELEGLYVELLGGSPGKASYLRAKAGEARGMKEMARGSLLMSKIFPSPVPRFSSPFLPSIVIDQDRADRGRYRQRFGWIQPGSDVGIARTRVDYEIYLEVLHKLEATERSSLTKEAKSCYERVIDALTIAASVPLAERGSAVRPEFVLRGLASSRRTAFANQNKLTSLLNEPASTLSPSQTRPAVKWDHAWFPIFP